MSDADQVEPNEATQRDGELRSAQAVLAKDKLMREEACRVELGEVLKRHRCTLIMVPHAVQALTIGIMPTVQALE